MLSYTVDLDTFQGPLDLLLYLVRRNEVDILDIPIARLAEQFLEYLQVAKSLDVELAGEFLVMAATLMEIKSRSLLPHDKPNTQDEEEDPRRELVRQLLEYRAYKDAAQRLEERAEQHASKLARKPIPEPTVNSPTPVRPVELWDLISAFARLMRETQTLGPTTVMADDTPQHVYEAEVRRRIEAEGKLPFQALFTPPWHRTRLIGLFLAVLELIKIQADRKSVV